MKIANKILVLLLVVVLVFSFGVSASSKATPSQVRGQVGQTVLIKFEYPGIACIQGEFKFSNPDIISDVSLKVPGMMGSFKGNEAAYFNPADGVVTMVLELSLTISKTAKVGDTCTVTFEYESSTDGYFSDEKDLKTDTVTLTVRPYVDYSALEAAIARAELLNKENYTTTSWDNLCTALDAARKALDSESQTEVDQVCAALEAAILALQVRLNFDRLNLLISTAQSLKETDYTSNSWLVLEKALNDAIAARNSTNQAQIDAAADALDAAILGLKRLSESGVDYSALQKQIKIAEALKRSDYTSASWTNLSKALTAARAALRSDSQATVDAAALALKNAIAALVPVSSTGVDYSELNRQIAIAEGLRAQDYTKKSWDAMTDALSSAISARGSKSQSFVDRAASALKKAINALVRVQIGVDYTELNKQISIAQGLDEKLYTDASWAVLENALADAVAASTSTLQTEVDVAAVALKNAIAALVRMDYQALIDAINAVKQFLDNEELAQLLLRLNELLTRANELLNVGDQAAVDACAKELQDLLVEILAKLEELKSADTIIVEKPVPSDPTDDFCNIGSHRVWPILFWISLALNLGLVGLIVVYVLLKRKKTRDDMPLVDYDIADDAE